ncbi:FtsK/SpoIIIE domain-containing protein [Mesobacillus maritimus]|uniref:DNA translocase FtsK n=1 Tax=Mesobacillus maritimus TaxID=1643336 RepID=UPI00203BD1B5|nr:FtsK/SpoIIIE domain-containing protein [Mesobacillus maritimus]
MSWIKRLLQMFSGEEENEPNQQDDHQSNTNRSKQRPLVESDTKEYKKEVETRVLYKYPKGQFKFPLIPDPVNEKRNEPRRKREEAPIMEEQKFQAEEQKRRPIEKPIEKPIQKSKPKPTMSSAKVSSIPHKGSRQPFRPTETPSPIFAFNNRPKPTGEVEYELKGFNKGDSDGEKTKENDVIGIKGSELDFLNRINKQKTNENVFRENNKREPFLSKAQEKEVQGDYVLEEQIQEAQAQEVQAQEEQIQEAQVQVGQAQVEQIQEAQVQEVQAQEEQVQEEQVQEVQAQEEQVQEEQVQEVQAQEEQVQEEQVQEEQVQEVQVQEEEVKEVQAQEEQVQEEQAQEVQAQEEQVQEVQAQEEQVQEEHTQETFVSAIKGQNFGNTEQLKSEAEEIMEHVEPNRRESETPDVVESDIVSFETESSTALDLDSDTSTQSITEKHDEVIETSIPSENEEQAIDENEALKEAMETVPVAATMEKAEKPKRKQLPFNVLMLKQDKRKMEERRKIGAATTTRLNTADSIQTKYSNKANEENQIEMEPSRQIDSKDHSLEETSNVISIIEKESTTESQEQNILLDAKHGMDLKDTKPEVNSKGVPGEAIAYQFPPLELLQPPVRYETNDEWLEKQQQILNETLINFNVGAKVVNVTQGPAVTRFEVQPEPGVKVNKITNLSDDIKLSLAAKDIRMEAPIPGKHTIGIEVPNAVSRPVLISEILSIEGFNENKSPLSVALGLDIAGTPVVTDLKKMPHGLIAGATGSGKSVCINTMLVSLLYKAHPDDVKLLLIDPKMVELAPYNHIPHLVSPVITDVKAATASLKWAVEEMERRYELFAHTGVRDIGRFNELAIGHGRYAEKLPYIVIVIDELADLMMMSPADVEEAISRIAQKARACGIHLIIATQRPSVDVITGLIKANVPTRIAFSVSSQVDSRTIIDISGAEKLLGRGDMLFLESGSSKPFRLQGTFVSDEEIDEIVAFVRKQREPDYLFEQDELIKKSQITEEEDELFYDACLYVIEQGGASTSSIQRRFKIGYNRAARLIDMMEQNGFISEGRGSKPRDVLISLDDLEAFHDS